MRIYRNLHLLMAGAWLVGCTAKSETKKEADKPAVPVVQLTQQEATLDLDYAGQIEAVQNVEVPARVGGYLDKMLVDEGQSVHKSQLLFQLNPAEYQVKIATVINANCMAVAPEKHWSYPVIQPCSSLSRTRVSRAAWPVCYL